MARKLHFKTVHQTWHFTVCCVGILVGIVASVWLPVVVFASVSWVILGALLFMFALWKRWRWLIVIAFLAGCLIGVARGAFDKFATSNLAPLYGKEVTITGLVSEDTDVDKRGNTTLRLSHIQVNEHIFSGTLWVSLASKTDEIWRSDTVTIKGKLSEGFGNFVGTMYRASVVKVQRPTPGDVALQVRDAFGKEVRAHIHEPAASLGMGYIAGQKRALPNDLAEALKIAGLTHVVVASGYNLTILVRFARRFFEKVSRFTALFAAGILVISFICITGMSPSMMRAGMVAGLALVAWYFGRKFHPVTLIAGVAAATGLLVPSDVWGSLGWQLSFLSFAGVMILAPLLQHYFFGKKKPGTIRQVLGETFSAQLATTPIILYAFGTFSTVALFANLLVLPLIPLAMLLTFLTGVFSYISGWLADMVALPTQWLLDYMVWVAKRASSFSWSSVEWQISPWLCVGMYVVLIVIILYLKRTTKLRLRDSNIIE